MASVVPPKFKAFTKTKVVLAIEPTPYGLGQSTDLTDLAKSQFRDPSGKGPDSELKGPGAEELEAIAAPEMFSKKKGKKSKKNISEGALLPPGLVVSVLKKGSVAAKQRAPGAGKAKAVYSRMDVMSRDLQASEVGKLSETLQKMAKGLLDVETSNPYEVEPVETFVPMSRRGFGSFLVDQYGPIFPKGAPGALNVATCAAKGQEGVKEVKIYHYQAFIREYLRFETPYRGLLVYHGLGSGKTCSAIAAAEALFGTRGLKIIVMTPFSLRDNFISEINFCGFKHFRLQNHWTSLSLAPGSTPDPAMVKMFAQSVYGIPDSYFAKKGKGRPPVDKIWIPDFESEPNFDGLSPQDRDEIKTQLKVTIENRIRFINYNGITARDLKTMVCSTPEIFDNSVIVVDEIHNLTRLMQGSLEPYFSNPPGRRRTLPLEVLTPERKKLPLCGMTKNYMRGYLFYRLFMDAKNAKIIGLSGTPLINFPEELGILSNILHGAIQRIDFTVTVEGMRDIRPLIEGLVLKNENLDTVHFTASEGSMDVTVTRLPEQFTKVFADDGDVIGIERRAPGKAAPTLEQIWIDLEANMKLQKIGIRGKGQTKAQELLPSWDTPFRGAFLQEDGVTLKNVTVLQKRMRGLFSYYRGIQGDVMPKVIKDEIVGIPLKGYSLKVYNKLRNQEIQVEMKKPKGTGASAGDAVWAEINEIASMKSSSNYRMSSRQACNFAFPEGVTRPRPGSLEELDAETGKDRDGIIEADTEDRVAGKDEAEIDAEDDAEAVAEARAEIAAPAPSAVQVAGTKEAKAAYNAALKAVKEKLRTMGQTHLKLDGPSDRNLAKYSPKYAAMLTNINALRGSSLVYSTFLEMEGIGIFGICMEANGYVPIQIISGSDGKLKFSDKTIASLAKGPKVPEKRYIEFTGVGTKEQRGAAVDVFNARFDKLTPALQKVLQDAGWENNFDGGLCRAFCITSAGAEGLSLKCVRGVHIMEPYWNSVRTQQVKGRAVRICSHMDLPKEEQNVSIYTYCTIIPEEAILAQAVDKTLERSDTYSAKAAAELGVPVPRPRGAGDPIVPDEFFKVAEGVEEEEVKQEASKDGPVRFFSKLDNEFRGFSNFAPAPVNIEGKRYPTVEHFFQASRFPSDVALQEAIRVSPTPAKAKEIGTANKANERPDWDSQKERVMLSGLRAKFQQNTGLLEQLKSTGARPIIEASTDAFWGEGRTGKGKNRMGKLLEQIRVELKDFVSAPVPLEASKPSEDVAAFFEGDEEELVAAPPAAAVAAPAPAVAAPPVQVANPVTDMLGIDEEALEETGEQKGGGPGDEEHEDRTIILTSDQKVLMISLRKEKVLTSLQNIMKSVAVDCEMNLPDNYDGSYKCAALDGNIGDFAYHPELQKDIQETEARFKKAPVVAAAPAPAVPVAAAEAAVSQKPKPKLVEYRKQSYYYMIKKDEEGKPLGYLFYSTDDPELKTPIGFVKPHPVTGMPKGDILPVPAEFQ